jgi:hypothetical protein
MANNLNTINRKRQKESDKTKEPLYESTFGDKQELVGLGRHDSIHRKSNASNSEQTNRIKYEINEKTKRPDVASVGLARPNN